MAQEIAIRAGFSEIVARRSWDKHYQAAEDHLGIICTPGTRSDNLKSLYLGGDIGVGKTSFLAIMLKQYFRVWASFSKKRRAYLEPTAFPHAMYLTHRQFIDIIHRDIRDHTDVVEDVIHCPLLILDELGTATDAQSGFNLSRLEEVLDYRYSHRMTTWIASNLNLDDIAKRQGWERIHSRIMDREWMTVIYLPGEDRRL